MKNFITNNKGDCSGWFYLVCLVVALVIVFCLVTSTVNNSGDFKEAMADQNIILIKIDHVNPNSYNTIININGYDLIQLAKENNNTVYYDKEPFVPLWYYVQVGATIYNYKP